MRAILQTLPGLLDELRNPEAREAIAFAVWPTVIGEHLRERSVPLRLENKRLCVAVACREWKREFEQHAGNIVYKLNAGLKASIVERVDFVIDSAAVQGATSNQVYRKAPKVSANVLSKDVSEAASHIADPELRTNFLKAAATCIERRDAD
jgi:hypothetical protein